MPRPKRRRAAHEPRLEEVCRKMSLGQGLRLAADEGRPEFIKALEDFVDVVSKLASLGSLVFNAVLLKQNNADGDAIPYDFKKDSTYVNCFTVGTSTTKRKIHPTTVAVWNEEFQAFHGKVPEHPGQTQAVVYAAQLYKTNFFNSLWMNFNSRLDKFLHISLSDADDHVDHDVLHCVRGWIRNRETKKLIVLGQKEHELIEGTRALLQLEPEEQMWDDWAECKVKQGEIHHILNFYRSLRSILRETDKTFSLAPVHDVARRCIKIDTKVLFKLMRNAKLYKGTREAEFRKNAGEHFARVFKLKEQPGRMDFTNLVDTDGVSITFHYRRPKREATETEQKKKKAKMVQPGRNAEDVGVDTGLVNQVFAVRRNENGTFDRWVLRKGEYYESAGLNRATKKAQGWCAEISEEHALLTGVSSKSKDLTGFRLYLAALASGFDRLWEVKMKKKWARSKLRVYGGKNRVFDKFFGRMARDIGPSATVYWGDASVNPSMKGTKSAPTSRQLIRARLHLKKIELTDEFRTSKVCHCCDELIRAVKRRVVVDGTLRTREVRGLRWCSTSRKFVDRDLNAAANILRCGTARPESMTRGTECKVQETLWKRE